MLNPFHLLPATRRTMLTLACATGLAATSLVAQQPDSSQQPAQTTTQDGMRGHGGDRQERQLEHLTKALHLTPDQVAQIKSIQTSSRQQMMALHQDAATAPADRRARMMSLHQTETSSIRGVLNDDQKTKFDTMQARMKERRQERQDSNQAPPPPAA